MNLRPYQIEAIKALEAAWKEHRRNLLILPTGGGKTVVFLYEAMRHIDTTPSARVLIIAHRKELIDQPRERIAQMAPQWLESNPLGAPRVGIIQAARKDFDRQLTIATVQSLRPQALERYLAHGAPTLIIVDECFVAGTLIDGRAIETIKAGDTVTAFDEKTGSFVKAPVVRTFTRTPSALCRVTVGSKTIVCTPNHPFYTRQGWIDAAKLEGTEVLVYGSGMQCLSSSVLSDEESVGSVATKRTEGVLLEGVQQRVLREPVGCTDGRNQPKACIGANEGPQPNEKYGVARENERDASCDGSSALCSRRQRQGLDGPASGLAECARGNGCSGACCADGCPKGEYGSVASSLQDRHCDSVNDDCYRDRRPVTRCTDPSSAGHQENSVSDWARVDRVEVLEQTSDGTFGGVCPDGVVYNFEVEGVHTYTANDIVVHNCHHTIADSYVALLEACTAANPAVKVLGVTATPERSDKTGLIEVFDNVAYKLSIATLIRLGWLVKPRWLGICVPEIDFSDVKRSAGDYQSGDVAAKFDTPRGRAIILQAWQKYASERRTVAYTASVEGAHDLAEAFQASGVRAAAIDGTTPKETREAVLAAFAKGDYQVVVNCMILTEGWDCPAVDCILMCRPTQSDGLYLQCLGRGLRPSMGKATEGEDCLVLDFMPKNARNIVLAGDVLGMPRDLNDAMMVAAKDQDEADEEQIAFGFTFDGDEWHTAGTALEIVAMELNYLNASPLAWHRDADGIMTTGLGQDAIMMIVPKNKEYTLVRLDRDGWNYNHTVEEKGDIETVQTKADDIALEANMFLAGRSSRWRNDQPSDKQVAYLTKIAKKAGVKVPSDLNKGTCAELITHCQALLWLKTIRAQKGWA